jgi:hypothetical protein
MKYTTTAWPKPEEEENHNFYDKIEIYKFKPIFLSTSENSGNKF